MSPLESARTPAGRVRALRTYLLVKGWYRAAAGAAGERWVGGDGTHKLAIAVPYEHTEPDSIDWLWRKALEGISEAEGRPADELEVDIFSTTTDVVRIRLHGSGVRAGELKLANVPEIYQGVERLIKAAAKSTNAANPSQAPAGGTKALLDEAVLLPAAAGSVILSVVGPQLARGDSDSELTIDGLGGTKAAYERRVFERLLTGCHAAKAAADRTLHGKLGSWDQEADPLAAEREAGLTAELCTALLELSGHESGLHASLEVAVGWAAVGEPSTVPARVEFERNAVLALESVQKVLTARSSFADTTVTGRIERASRPSPTEFGEITVAAKFEDIEAKLKFSLRDETSFAQAVDALKAGAASNVRFKASLAKDRKAWTVRSHEPLEFFRGEL